MPELCFSFHCCQQTRLLYYSDLKNVNCRISFLKIDMTLMFALMIKRSVCERKARNNKKRRKLCVMLSLTLLNCTLPLEATRRFWFSNQWKSYTVPIWYAVSIPPIVTLCLWIVVEAFSSRYSYSSFGEKVRRTFRVYFCNKNVSVWWPLLEKEKSMFLL